METTMKRRVIESESARNFAGILEEKIEASKESFFYTANNAFERKQNEEVRKKEKRGDREFDYQRAIPLLMKKISSIDSSERERVMRTIMGGVSYRITGIYVDGLRDHSRNGITPLLADVAEDPQKYFNHN